MTTADEYASINIGYCTMPNNDKVSIKFPDGSVYVAEGRQISIE